MENFNVEFDRSLQNVLKAVSEVGNTSLLGVDIYGLFGVGDKEVLNGSRGSVWKGKL